MIQQQSKVCLGAMKLIQWPAIARGVTGVLWPGRFKTPISTLPFSCSSTMAQAHKEENPETPAKPGNPETSSKETSSETVSAKPVAAQPTFRGGVIMSKNSLEKSKRDRLSSHFALASACIS